MLLPKQSRNYVTGLAAACSLLLIACSPEEVRQVNLIPKPEQMTMTGGTFTVDSLALFGGQSSRNIKTVIDEAWSGNPEGYQLDVTPGGIDLRAGSPDGLFYGMQTLRQLYAGGEVPCVSIRDNPRFGYRGLHLDVSRHFFSKEEVMKLLDVMSFYKLNTLHMHLTDAGGWRIEIDKYPKLTSETAFRTESDWRKWWDGRDRKYLPEGTPGAYGGYYTKEDIREIVKHAASKHINIIPEIEFPGHSEEVLMAYPELSCSGKPYQNGDFCIGNELSFTFMEDVLAEVIDLFPSEYIHVGGDEAGKSAWKKCPKCQALMKEKGTLCSTAKAVISSPATTNVSLFANAIALPALIAAIVGFSPAYPTIAVSTISIGSDWTTWAMASEPAHTLMGRSSNASFSSGYFCSLAITTTSGIYLRA